jgi:CRISPR system Cascade subunit CasD
MQSWGTSSRIQLRRTDRYPSKSGVLGMLLCAMGVPREDSERELEPLNQLLMGVRIDRSGTLDWDYHTAGAKIGIRRADGKRIKMTASTKEKETLLSRRQYLYDASFLVALQGATDTIIDCAEKLANPVWPLFLGRKCCIPAEPAFIGTGSFDTLTEALSSISWQPQIDAIDRGDNKATRTLDIYMEHPPGHQIPMDARLVYDVPRRFGFFSYNPRWVVKDQVDVMVGEAIQRLQPPARRGDPYSKHFRDIARPSRLKLDNDLCVFCKSPAVEVHHVSYENAGCETDSDLRSLCKLCHNACTMLEYGHDMKHKRVDPSDPDQRQDILDQIERLLKERRQGRRRKLLKAARKEL